MLLSDYFFFTLGQPIFGKAGGVGKVWEKMTIELARRMRTFRAILNFQRKESLCRFWGKSKLTCRYYENGVLLYKMISGFKWSHAMFNLKQQLICRKIPRCI